MFGTSFGWIGKTGGALANFSGRDLSGLKFGRWDLRHASFAGANLSGIHATETRFCYCDFAAADLSGARTFDCDFRSARFKRASLVGAQILDTRDDWPMPVGDEELWYCGGGFALCEDQCALDSALLVGGDFEGALLPSYIQTFQIEFSTAAHNGQCSRHVCLYLVLVEGGTSIVMKLLCEAVYIVDILIYPSQRMQRIRFDDRQHVT